MRRQSLFHVHNLAYLIAEYVSEDIGDSAGVFEAYDDLDVHPYAVDIRKRAHYDATVALMDGTIEQITQHSESRRSAESGAEEAQAD